MSESAQLETLRHLQHKVGGWLRKTFPKEVVESRNERCCRAFEEMCELVQAGGLSREKAADILEYIYDRPPNADVVEELGDSLFTTLALAEVFEISALTALKRALRKAWDNQEKIRDKNMSKKFRGDDL